MQGYPMLNPLPLCFYSTDPSLKNTHWQREIELSEFASWGEMLSKTLVCGMKSELSKVLFHHAGEHHWMDSHIQKRAIIPKPHNCKSGEGGEGLSCRPLANQQASFRSSAHSWVRLKTGKGSSLTAFLLVCSSQTLLAITPHPILIISFTV